MRLSFTCTNLSLGLSHYDWGVSTGEDDRDELITELLAEAHGLRMKNEQISLYTESKIAELVKLQRELLTIRDGFETVVEQRNDLYRHDRPARQASRASCRSGNLSCISHW